MSQFTDPRELRHQAAQLMATAAAIEDGTWGAIIDGPGTTVAVAEAVGCSISGASNRLRKLYDLKLLDREQKLCYGGGRYFIYRVAVK